MSAIAQAEQQLRAAHAEEAQRRRDGAKQEIVKSRQEGATLLRQLRPMARQIQEAQNERLRLGALLTHARDQIAAYSQPLDPLDFPTDEQIAEHAQQLEAWRSEQQQLLARHAAAKGRESIRPAAVALQSRLENLRFRIQNLSSIAEGRAPGQMPDGGLFRVGENFLGSGPFVRPPR
jgi:chromosome segregation ATPase